jgi:hypothetical protein
MAMMSADMNVKSWHVDIDLRRCRHHAADHYCAAKPSTMASLAIPLAKSTSCDSSSDSRSDHYSRADSL